MDGRTAYCSLMHSASHCKNYIKIKKLKQWMHARSTNHWCRIHTYIHIHIHIILVTMWRVYTYLSEFREFVGTEQCCKVFIDQRPVWVFTIYLLIVVLIPLNPLHHLKYCHKWPNFYSLQSRRCNTNYTKLFLKTSFGASSASTRCS